MRPLHKLAFSGRGRYVLSMFCGLDRLGKRSGAGLRERLGRAPFGVLSHSAALDRHGRGILPALAELNLIPARVLTPEHGFDGVAQAEEAVTEHAHVAGVEAVGLYGATRESLTPTAEQLAGLETLLIDVVDVGSRYYTYVWTALLAARAARARGIHCVVLDRPNPLTGDALRCEGAPQRLDYRSFVGLEPVPIRHGLTVGELLARELERDGAPLGVDGALSIVGVAGWERHKLADAWDRPFIPPSPNMPTLETALLYPGGCLLEGTNLSEGRGTAMPFRVVGAPFLDGEALAASLMSCELPGLLARPTAFRPSFDKHAGALCRGVMLHVGDPARFRPVATYLALIHAAHRQAPEAFEFLTRCYEFESDRLAFDLLTGTPSVREQLLADAPLAAVLAEVCPVPEGWADEVREAELRARRAEYCS